jgi:predicted RNase H-like nuclease (RuvC/YqgF family)
LTRDWLLEEQKREPTMYTGKKRKFGMSVDLSAKHVVIPEFNEFILNNEEIIMRGVIEDITSDLVGAFRTCEERAREVFRDQLMAEDVEEHSNPSSGPIETKELPDEAKELLETMKDQLRVISSKIGLTVDENKKDCSKDRLESLETELRISREKNQQLQKQMDRQTNVLGGLMNENNKLKEMYQFKFTVKGRKPSIHESARTGYICHTTINFEIHKMYLIDISRTGVMSVAALMYDLGKRIPEIEKLYR